MANLGKESIRSSRADALPSVSFTIPLFSSACCRPTFFHLGITFHPNQWVEKSVSPIHLYPTSIPPALADLDHNDACEPLQFTSRPVNVVTRSDPPSGTC
jgi:hypothetical protein